MASLRELITRAGYPSVVSAVAAHAVFLPPATIRQTHGMALFRTIRDFGRRGELDVLPDGRRVMLDDNTSPTDAFLWSAGLSRGRDVQFNHVWSRSRDADSYTALWNVCATPAFLAKTTDGSNHPEVTAALAYRSFDLFGHLPGGVMEPDRPEGYASLRWAPFAPAVANLEREIRVRLARKPRSRTAIACREVGWLFSGWEPDPTV